MKFAIRLGPWLAAVLLFLAPAAALAEEAAGGAPEKILFVGNSFTYFNNSLHGHLRKLLLDDDPETLDTHFLKAMTISGERLASHEGGLRQMLELYPWDVVVLQGHSLEAVDPEKRPGLEKALRNLSALVRTHDATPRIFMTWAYRDRPEMTDTLVPVYTELGSQLETTVVPVGMAFAEALAAIPGLDLHHPDGIHPSLEGTYLAACVFFAALYGRSPEGNGYTAGIDAGLAAKLQISAWRTVNRYYLGQ